MSEAQAENMKKPSEKADEYLVRTLALAVVALLGVGVFTWCAYRQQKILNLKKLRDSADIVMEQTHAQYDNTSEAQRVQRQITDELYAGRIKAAATYLMVEEPATAEGKATPDDTAVSDEETTDVLDTELPLEVTFERNSALDAKLTETTTPADPLASVTQEQLAELADRLGAAELYLLDATGATQCGSTGRKMPVQDTEQLAQLEAGEPVIAEPMYRCFYAAPCGTGYVVMAVDATAYLESGNPYMMFGNIGSMQFGSNGSVMIVDTKDNTFVYATGGFTGESITEAGLQPGQLTDGFADWLPIGGVKYYAVCSRLDDRFLALAVEEETDVTRTVVRYMAIPLFVFALLVLAIVLYAGLVVLSYRKERVDIRYLRIGRLYGNRTLAGRLFSIILTGLLLFVVAVFFAQTLMELSTQSLYANSKLMNLKATLQLSQTNTDRCESDNMDNCTGQARLVAWMIDRKPVCGTHALLTMLAQDLGAGQIDVYDGNGAVRESSTEYEAYSLSDDETQPSYALRSLLYGDDNDIMIVLSDVDEVTMAGAPYACMAAARRTDNTGLVRLTFDSDKVTRRLQLCSIDNAVETTGVAAGECVFIINGQTHIVDDATLIDFWGVSMQELTLADGVLDDSYTGYQSINGHKFFLNGIKYNDNYLYVALEDRFLHNGRTETVVYDLIIGFAMAVLLLAVATLGIGKNPTPLTAPAREKQVTVTLPDGKTRRMGQEEARFYKSVRSWHEKTVEGKFRSLMTGILGICILLAAAGVQYLRYAEKPDLIVEYILGGEWERGVNIFAITGCIAVFAVVFIVSWLFRRLIRLMLHDNGNIMAGAQMLDGAIKYGSLIGAGLYCLNLLGIHTATLVTSASVASVVLGFGAQSLIGDILAGIFIVVENEFRVGDIVTVDGWRGTVREIGIRTTKIEDLYGNIKIFNNTQISGVINMTKEYSVAEVDVGIEYGEDLQRVEAVLKEQAFPRMREHLPAIKKGPFYAGVLKLGDSSVVLRMTAQCEENSRIMLERDMNREIKLIFDENHINIPFPQVVLHQGAEIKPTAPDTAEAADKTENDLATSVGV